MIRTVSNPRFWLLAASLALITIPHYGDMFEHPAFITHLLTTLGLERHAFERILYLAPIVWAGFLFGRRGVVITSLVALAIMLPRALLISSYPNDAIFETVAVFIVGNLVALSFEALRKERERRIHLTALNRTSSMVSQSLELDQVLKGSIKSVIGVMKVDAVLVYLVDEKAGELAITAYQGISAETAQGVDRLKLGEGFNGRVALTGEPLYVEDTSRDPSLTKMAVKEEGIKSQLIVPLKAKGKVVGTLCVAVRSHHQFRQEEMELLTAIGNEIGVAIENARLYKQEHDMTEQLRTSEERYRGLFESAHDAIWVHDLEGNIQSANKAFALLTGYTVEEMVNKNVKNFLPPEGLQRAREIRQRLLQGQAIPQPYEQNLIRKDGTEGIMMLTTNLVYINGQPSAFQNIARDITEEKRMQENLRFYVQQITRAQEEERKRIARELHDDTIQALVVLSRQLDYLTSSGKRLSKDNKLLLEDLRQQTNGIMEGVRRLSQDLRPHTLDRLGMVPALEWLASDIRRYSNIAVKLKVHGTERRLPAEMELLLFRIAQEALSNVWRHSQATEANIIVDFDQRNTGITIKDNGKGFDPPRTVGDLARNGRLGLAGMQERAQLLGGTLTLQSEPGKGTTVTVTVPA